MDTEKINLEEKHLKIVMDILSQAPKINFYAFGSRVNNTNKRYSDFDICFKGKIEPRLLRNIKTDFYESKLPFKVDLVAYDQLPESFKKSGFERLL